MRHHIEISRFVRFFEHLTPQDLDKLGECYAVDARFKDPFNEVQGLSAIRRIFEHMFASLHEPQFIVKEQVLQDNHCFLTWDFCFRFKRFQTDQWQTIQGATHLVLNERGQVTLHRDYWDAAEELYEKLPWVGGFMRWLKARANT